MSTNKTIKALRQEREELYAELRSLRPRVAIAADFPPLPEGFTQPASDGSRIFFPSVSKLDIGNGEEVRYSFTVADEVAPVTQEAFESIELAIDWATAPEGATHRNGPHGLWYKFDFEADTAMFCTDFARKWSDGDKASVYVADGSLADMIARPTGPVEKWSLNGENGSWDYDTLAELLKDYSPDHVDAGPHGSYNSEAVYEGSAVYRAIECKDDPAGFLPDANQITEIMFDNAASSDAGEWVDGYPELDSEALQAMDKALEPLKAWARRYCQPKFFTVKDITPYTVTAEDVRAAQ